MSDFLHKCIDDEYLRWMNLIGNDDPYDTPQTVGLRQVVKAHFLIIDYFIEIECGVGGIGPRDLDLLHSAVYRQFVSFNGVNKWKTQYEKCATLLYGLVKDHPFHDANKRTGFLTTLYYLDKINLTPSTSQKEFENFIVDIADNKLVKYQRYERIEKNMTDVSQSDVDIYFIADFLRRNSREVDRRPYTVTFHELNGILKKYGYELKNPNKNYIDVVRLEKKRRFFGMGPTVEKECRVTQVGFPGWKKQVGKGALKKVREETKLTAEHGYDSRVFFQGADPLHSLIDLYSEPLKRLANR